MVTAIILSGGVGSCLHSDTPKQYIRVGGYMVIIYSNTNVKGGKIYGRYLNIPDIDTIIAQVVFS